MAPRFERLAEINAGLTDGWRIGHETMTVAGKVSRRPYYLAGNGVIFPGRYASAEAAKAAIARQSVSA